MNFSQKVGSRVWASVSNWQKWSDKTTKNSSTSYNTCVLESMDTHFLFWFFNPL